MPNQHADGCATLDYGQRGNVQVVPDSGALARVAADLFAEVTSAAVADRDRATVVLSGGSTPQRMGELLATPPYRDRVPWQNLDVFWGDERWVPPDSPESNAGTTQRICLDHVPIPPAQVHPFPTVGLTPEQAAIAYTDQLRAVFGDEKPPRFDLILLGMGDDGHTASLFPGTAAVHERNAWVVAHLVPKLGQTRLTLTAPLLNAGRKVIFLAGGAGKAATLAAVLDGPRRPDELPAQIVQPTNGSLLWLIDAPAASRLAKHDGGGHG